MAIRRAGERYPADGTFDSVTIADGAGHFLKVPRLTQGQRDGLSPANGLVVYNDTAGRFERYQDGWGPLGGGDMYKATYDSDDDGVVDDAAHLEGSTRAEVQDHDAVRLRTGPDADKPGSGNAEGDVWWAQDTDTFYVWNGSAWQAIGGGGGATVAFPQAQAFSGTAPTSWADLDLSPIVGANSALAFLRVNSTSSAAKYRFRRNGEPNTYHAYGTAYSYLGSNLIGTLLVVTDASGIVEWYCEDANNTTVDVEAYIKA